VEAVDGRDLNGAQLEASGLFIPPLPFPTMGAYGCALSHLKLWEWAIANDTPVTVAEDDAVFRDDFAQASAAFVSQLRDDWDLVLWGWNFDCVLSVTTLGAVSPALISVDQDSLRANIAAFKAMRRMPDPMGLDVGVGTPAYTISAAGARKFRQQCFPIRNIELRIPLVGQQPITGIDMAMCRIYRSTNSFVAFPPLVAVRNEGSTVQSEAAQAAARQRQQTGAT
jgi:GR25 family glycosyltransferase involved in LPS biosynthesis